MTYAPDSYGADPEEIRILQFLGADLITYAEARLLLRLDDEIAAVKAAQKKGKKK